MTSNKEFTIIAIAVIAILGMAVLTMIASAKKYNKDQKAAQKSQWVSHTEAGGIGLVTVEHDNHMLIVLKSSYGMQLMHHPSCVCLKEN